MNNQSLRENLEWLMKIHGNLSISEVARLADVPQPTLHHILSGATKKPRIKALEALAAYFSVTIRQLMGEEILPRFIPEAVKLDLKIKTIPVIDWDILKDWPQINIQEYKFKEVLLDKEMTKNSFALIMRDGSMEPMIPMGAMLVFDFEKKTKDRDFVIAFLSNKNQINFNRLFIEGNETYIKFDQLGDDAKLIKLNFEVDRIIAVLSEIRIQF